MALTDLIRDSDLVFIGRVANVEAPPLVASGSLSFFRRTTYDVETVLKGSLGAATSEVDHFVVSDQRDRAPATTTDPITPFRLGARLLVFARLEEDPDDETRQRYEEIDYDDGVFELTDNLSEQLVRALSRAPSLGVLPTIVARLLAVVAVVLIAISLVTVFVSSAVVSTAFGIASLTAAILAVAASLARND